MKIWHWLSRKAIEHYVFSFRTSTFRAFKVLGHEGKCKLAHWLISLCGIHLLGSSTAPSFPILISSVELFNGEKLQKLPSCFNAPFPTWWSLLWLENLFFGSSRLSSLTPPYSQHWQLVSTWWCDLHIHNLVKKKKKSQSSHLYALCILTCGSSFSYVFGAFCFSYSLFSLVQP